MFRHRMEAQGKITSLATLAPTNGNGDHAPLACRLQRRAETLAWFRQGVRRDAGHGPRAAESSLDHATSEIASRSKSDIDAAKKNPGKGFKRPRPPLIRMDAAVKAKVGKLFNP